MIRVQKSSNEPDKLKKDGKIEMNRHRKDYDSDPEQYRSGKRKFAINRQIYADQEVKRRLMEDQYNKCCYCESMFRSTSHGDVEHFRPKQGVRQSRGNRLVYPGYYWLIYEWSNLYYSC